jgi:hypothetical protein
MIFLPLADGISPSANGFLFDFFLFLTLEKTFLSEPPPEPFYLADNSTGRATLTQIEQPAAE